MGENTDGRARIGGSSSAETEHDRGDSGQQDRASANAQAQCSHAGPTRPLKKP